MSGQAVENHTFQTGVDVRYLLHLPERSAYSLAVLALHGYGSTPEAMLRLTLPVVGAGAVVAAIQAPHQHYAGSKPEAASEVAYNWGVRNHFDAAVRTHHEIVLKVLSQLRERFGLGADRCVLLGFSQPVGLNYRFIGTHPDAAGGVIGLCGGVPRDWEDERYRDVGAPILHISRNQDEYFPREVAEGFPQRLRRHAKDVEFHMMDGGHWFPSKARAIVQPWLGRVFGESEIGTMGNS